MVSKKQFEVESFFWPLLLAIITANSLGLITEIIGPDGTLYASIAKHITQTNDWINLYGNGSDWLDKPHLPFWLAAASFKVFGINAFAYKLPNFLAFVLALFYIYKLCKQFLSVNIAKMAVLIFAGSLHIILCNTDVRAEIFLTAFIIASTYHFYKSIDAKIGKDIVLSAFFAALAIMTKGLFVLITIASGFIFYWIKTKDWKQFIAPKWYLLLFLIFVFILPELFCLYKQFDLHPEKNVFGKTGVSGLKFFFWDSQFGRFLNTGPITGEGDIFFFLHTTLWAFLPWTFALLLAILFFVYTPKKFKSIKQNKLVAILNFSALVSFLIFSFSKFQLPHYIVILFPHFSILIAFYFNWEFSFLQTKWIRIFLWVLLLIISGFVSALVFYLDLPDWWLLIIGLIAILVLFISFYKYHIHWVLITKAVFLMCFLAVFLNCIFYPALLKFQGGMMAGIYQNELLPQTTAYMYRCNDYNFEFYGNAEQKRLNFINEVLTKKGDSVLLYTENAQLKFINADSFLVKPINNFKNFHVTQLTAEFLNPATRSRVTDTVLLAWCIKK